MHYIDEIKEQDRCKNCGALVGIILPAIEITCIGDIIPVYLYKECQYCGRILNPVNNLEEY